MAVLLGCYSYRFSSLRWTLHSDDSIALTENEKAYLCVDEKEGIPGFRENGGSRGLGKNAHQLKMRKVYRGLYA